MTDNERKPQIVAFIYEHTHECSMQGNKFHVTPIARAGALLVDQVICPETGTELERVEEVRI